MRDADFAFLARLVRRRSGLSLTPDKMALAERRLAPVMQRFDFRDPEALIRELALGHEALAEAVTQAMLVNDSSFFRDPTLFASLRDTVLPRLLAARPGKRLRIWSAACATGQEAWSIAILLNTMGLARQGWTIELIATDLSAQAIARAQAGRYAPCEIERGLDGAALGHFHKDGDDWVVDDALRRMVTFRRFNLLDSYGWLDDMDIIFCRNVLMYFEPATRADVLARMADILADDGVLLLGENEAMGTSPFSPGGDNLYVKSRAALARAG